jgi:hypothetical protein
MKNNICRNNIVENILHSCGDGGAIYRLGPQPNSVCRENYFKDMEKYRGGLYHDMGTAHWSDLRNIIDNTSEYWYFKWTGEPAFVDSNWYNSGGYQGAGTTNGGHNVQVSGDNWPPEAQTVIDNAGLEPEFEDIMEPLVLLPPDVDAIGTRPRLPPAGPMPGMVLEVRTAGGKSFVSVSGTWESVAVYDVSGRRRVHVCGKVPPCLALPRLPSGVYSVRAVRHGLEAFVKFAVCR